MSSTGRRRRHRHHDTSLEEDGKHQHQHHHQHVALLWSLGVTEFAAKLQQAEQQQQPMVVLQTLQRFIKVVRYERRLAIVSLQLSEHYNQNNNDNNNNNNSKSSSTCTTDSDNDEDEDEELLQLPLLLPNDNNNKNNDSTTTPANKRLRKEEAWKQDIANYNVPFVGTSIFTPPAVAAASSTTSAIQGDNTAGSNNINNNSNHNNHNNTTEWPTGFLKVYLQKSPLAVELIANGNALFLPPAGKCYKRLMKHNNHNNKLLLGQQQQQRHRMAFVLQKLYYLALSELITAAIPLERLIQTTTTTSSATTKRYMMCGGGGGSDNNKNKNQYQYRFLAQFVQHRLSGLFSTIQEETGHKGKMGIPPDGCCGELVPYILTVLNRLAMTNDLLVIRQVARGIEQELSESVVRLLLKRSIATINNNKDHPSLFKPNKVAMTTKTTTTTMTPRHKARAAVISLAATLAKVNDAMVFSSISSPGARDRKIPPGILYLVFQEGLLLGLNDDDDDGDGDDSDDDDHNNNINNKRLYQAMQDFLQTIWHLLSLQQQEQQHSKRLIHIDMFSREAVHNLTQLALRAPRLSQNEVWYETVLLGQDKYEKSLTSLQQAAIVARRVLFVLVARPEQSPLLQQRFRARYSNKQQGVQAFQIVIASLISLLDGDPSRNMQNFVLYCMRVTPQLLAVLFQNLQFPDTKQTFACLQKLNLASLLIRKGPTVEQYIGDDVKNLPSHEELMHSVLPRALKKQGIHKALQSRHPLLVSEALKMLVFAMRRCQLLSKALGGDAEDIDETFAQIASEWLPDPNIILLVMLQFGLQQKSSEIVIWHACHCIRTMKDTFPLLFQGNNIKFEWTKLVSVENGFHDAPFNVQEMVLQTLSILHDSQQMSPSSRFKSCREMIRIVISTRSERIRCTSRNVALKLMSVAIPSRSNKTNFASTEYEFACWLDGVTTGTIDNLISCMQESSLLSFQSFVDFAKAWKASGLSTTIPALSVSPLLVHALQSLPRSSAAFALLTCQVATRCLLYESNPLPLSIIIDDIYRNAQNEDCTTIKPLDELAKYSRSLIHFTDFSEKQKYEFLGTLLRRLFSGSIDIAAQANRLLDPKDQEQLVIPWGSCQTLAERIRNFKHVMSVVGDGRVGAHVVSLLRQQSLFILLENNLNDSIFSILLDCFHGVHQDAIDVLILVATASRKSSSKRSLPMEWLFSDRMNASVSSGKSMAYLHLIHPFLAPHVICSKLISLLAVLMTLTEDFPPLYVLISELILDFKSSFESVNINSSQSIDLSSLLVKLLADTPQCIASVEMINIFEDVLVCFLRAKSFWCSATIGAFSEHSKEKIISRCLRQKKPSGNPRMADFSLLDALVEISPGQYGAELLRQLHDSKCTENLLESSQLDNALLRILVEQSKGRVNHHAVIVGWKQSFITRICNFLQNPSNDNQQSCYQSSFTCLRRLLEAKQLTEVELIGISQALQVFLSYELRTKSPSELCLLCQESMIASAIQLCHDLSDDQTATVQELVTSVLLFMCTVTPRVLRAPSAVDGLIGPFELLNWAANVIESHQWQAENLEAQSLKKIHSMIRSCLRHGLSKSQNCQTRSLCLRVVQAFLMPASETVSALSNLSSKSLGAQVFEMITAHSEFDLIFRERRPELVAVVELLLCCMSETSDIDFDADLWDIFLCAFHAGVDEIDMSLRKLLTRYMQAGSIRMNHLRWGESTRHHDSKDEWDWLLDAFDNARVHSTLRSFPLFDSMDPFSSAAPNISAVTPLVYDDRSDATLVPYSPGFILPLVLAALEDSIFGSCDVRKVTDDFSLNKILGESTVFLVRRLCDNGVVSLALMALSSFCARVRRVSISIIGLVIVVVQSKEATELSTWRERPQIALILNSVQRALAIRLARNPTDESKTAAIPGVAALFLARSVLVLCRPRDRLYASINRYFLRIQKDHGAFPDLLRLPAFMSLFCSSVDDPDQLRGERMWALTVLRDGFLDESCYKPLLACHGMELILTSFYDARLRSFEDKVGETGLLLQIIYTVLVRGGDRCLTDLFTRVGLLPFLRSFVTERNLLEMLPTTRSRVLLVQLVETVFHKGGSVLSGEDFRASSDGFAEEIIQFSLKASQSDNGKVGAKSETIVSHAVSTLASLAFQGDKLSLKDSVWANAPSVCISGISFDSASAFLSKLNNNEVPVALRALCCLPSRSRGDDYRDASSFCVQVLEVVEKNKGEKDRLLPFALHKIKGLADFYKGAFDREDKVLQLVLHLRYACSGDEDVLKAWMECLNNLIGETLNQDKDTAMRKLGQRILHQYYHH